MSITTQFVIHNKLKKEKQGTYKLNTNYNTKGFQYLC